MAAIIGSILSNRYRIDESIGRGGMAEVYKAWDLQRATYLALKMLRQDLAEDTIFLRRFQREAQTLAKLQHPNIVRFYGIERDNYHVFMLMDYIEGTTLQRVLFTNEGTPLNNGYISHVMESVCAALHYAHSMGMVHCDIKPGNIMINKHDEVLLTDFGIARMTDSATSTMVGFGTPAYMAPELVRGQDPTTQSDIYSLGVVLYQMVTGGERPFTGEHASITGTVSDKVRWEHTYLQPPSPRTYNPNISTALEQLILQCLAKRPENRFSNTQNLFTSLQFALKPGGKGAGDSKNKHLELPLIIPLEKPTNAYKEESGSQGEPPALPSKKEEPPVPLPGANKRRIPVWVLWLVIGLALIGLGSGITFAMTSADRQQQYTDVSPSEVIEVLKPGEIDNLSSNLTMTLTHTLDPSGAFTATMTTTPSSFPGTNTITPMFTQTFTNLNTLLPTYTFTSKPYNTLVPGVTATNTPKPSNTNTPVATNTPKPTDTPKTQVPTNTPTVLPTNTPKPTKTPVPTDTPEPTDTPYKPRKVY